MDCHEVFGAFYEDYIDYKILFIKLWLQNFGSFFTSLILHNLFLWGEIRHLVFLLNILPVIFMFSLLIV